MSWEVRFSPEFMREFAGFGAAVRLELLAQAKLLEAIGPQLGRPRVDTLNGSRHANMKELRFSADGGEWRVAFAFDPNREAILLVGGNKTGVGQRRFYKRLISKADARFDAHLARLQAAKPGRLQ